MIYTGREILLEIFITSMLILSPIKGKRIGYVVHMGLINVTAEFLIFVMKLSLSTKVEHVLIGRFCRSTIIAADTWHSMVLKQYVYIPISNAPPVLCAPHK